MLDLSCYRRAKGKQVKPLVMVRRGLGTRCVSLTVPVCVSLLIQAYLRDMSVMHSFRREEGKKVKAVTVAEKGLKTRHF